jgi:SulP family sulfate permease
MNPRLQSLLQHWPAWQWLARYNRAWLASDTVAAVLVTVLLIPQSLAYALLAGLPAETGLYASVLPLVAYALLGSSRTLSVGPVAVASLMTAAAIADATALGLAATEVAVLLALLSGGLLLLCGLLRVGWVANFLSHPVVAGFVSASGLLIALSQVKHLLGIAAEGDTVIELVSSLAAHSGSIHAATAALGSGTLLFLIWSRQGLPALLRQSGGSAAAASLLSRAAPMLAVVVTTWLAFGFDLQARGVALVGHIPAGLPTLQWPVWPWPAVQSLLLPAALLALIGYVESVAVGKTLAARRGEKIDPDQELIGLGAANIAAAVSGGLPVTGGFSRSVVNFDAGAVTPMASLLTAAGIAVAALLLTPLLAFLPNATLAATICVAVLSLVDLSILQRTWEYSRSDFAAVCTTMLTTLLAGVEFGVSCGVLASLLLHLYRTSRPHVAEVGEVAGSGHFRNVKRHAVVTHPAILSLRIDESLYFANASYIEDSILAAVRQRSQLRHVVLLCSAVNAIDLSALEVLEGLNARLQTLGIGLHLSEVKGPVMDRLQHSDLLSHLNGRIFLSQQQAVRTLEAECLAGAQQQPGFADYQI